MSFSFDLSAVCPVLQIIYLSKAGANYNWRYVRLIWELDVRLDANNLAWNRDKREKPLQLWNVVNISFVSEKSIISNKNSQKIIPRNVMVSKGTPSSINICLRSNLYLGRYSLSSRTHCPSFEINIMRR